MIIFFLQRWALWVFMEVRYCFWRTYPFPMSLDIVAWTHGQTLKCRWWSESRAVIVICELFVSPCLFRYRRRISYSHEVQLNLAAQALQLLQYMGLWPTLKIDPTSTWFSNSVSFWFAYGAWGSHMNNSQRARRETQSWSTTGLDSTLWCRVSNQIAVWL